VSPVLISLLLVSAGPDPEPTPPHVAYAAGYRAWAALPARDRPYTRYLSLRNYPRTKRPDVLDAVAYAANATSWSQEIAYPPLAGTADDLIRIDLRWYAWDYWARCRRVERLEKQGIDLGIKDRAKFFNVWELLGDQDVVYRATHVNRYGRTVRGWIDPAQAADALKRGYTNHLVLDADTFLAFTGIDRDDGINKGFFTGVYSDLLMLPRKRSDLFKILGVQEQFVLDEFLKAGGAVDSSVVANNGRELVLFPTLVGQAQKFLWFSRDVLESVDSQNKRRSVTSNYLDTLTPDGGEAIFTIPNGMHAYWLENANQQQVREVPAQIAQDKTQPLNVPGRKVDVIVRNGFSCVSCHDLGINDFVTDDVVRRQIRFQPEGGRLEILAKDLSRAADLQQQVRSYYNKQLGRQVAAQSADYVERIKSTNHMDSKHNSYNYTELVRDYFFRPVTPEQASREFGIEPASLKAFVRDSRKQVDGVDQGLDLVPYLSGGTVTRQAFRSGFAAGMQGQFPYPWERVPVKKVEVRP
jgi:hypothetical protein